MKFYECTTVFTFTWEQVAQAFWKRYPNPQSKHVLSEDIVERYVKDGKLHTKRLLSKTNAIPKWAERFMHTKHVYMVEESVVDPKSKVLVTYTRNLSYVKVMNVTEKVIYMENSDHIGQTVALRQAWIDSQVRGFSRAICAFGCERFKSNCNKMVTGFNYVLGNMFPLRASLLATSPSAVVLANTTSKIKDVAKNASEMAKAKAAPIYAQLHPNQT